MLYRVLHTKTQMFSNQDSDNCHKSNVKYQQIESVSNFDPAFAPEAQNQAEQEINKLFRNQNSVLQNYKQMHAFAIVF